MYDAVVVGAGPAGGMAARPLAAAGFRTAILEKKKVVGEPVQCAEGVSEFGLASNGLRPREEWIAQRVIGAKCIAPNGTWFYITRLPGYAIHRPAFDRWLVDGAVDDGAQLRTSTKVTGISRHDGGWRIEANGETIDTRVRVPIPPRGRAAPGTGVLPPLHRRGIPGRLRVDIPEGRFGERRCGRPHRCACRHGGFLPQVRHRRGPEDADHCGFDPFAVRSDLPRSTWPGHCRRCRRHHEPLERGGDPLGDLQRAPRGRVRGDRVDAGGSDVHGRVRPGHASVAVPGPAPLVDDRPYPAMGRSAHEFRRRGTGRTRLAGREPAADPVSAAPQAVVGDSRTRILSDDPRPRTVRPLWMVVDSFMHSTEA